MLLTPIIYAFVNLAVSSAIAERRVETYQIDSIQHLSLSFQSRGFAGKVDVTVRPNLDNVTASGLSILYPDVPQSDLSAEFGGFPVVHGNITYPIPANPYAGYGALFGWIQFIKNTTGNMTGDHAVDCYPYACDLNDPFGGWGFNPTHYDAPAILLEEDPSNETVTWRAQSYLCELADAGKTKNVTVIKGGAFTWGYDMTFSANGTRSITIVKAELLDIVTTWEDRLPLLDGQYAAWTFNNASVFV